MSSFGRLGFLATLVLGVFGCASERASGGSAEDDISTKDFDGVPIQAANVAEYVEDLCALRAEIVNTKAFRLSPDQRYLVVARCTKAGSFIEHIDTRTNARTHVADICTVGCKNAGNVGTWSGGFWFAAQDEAGIAITLLDWELTARRRIELPSSSLATGFVSDRFFITEEGSQLLISASSESKSTWTTAVPDANTTVTAAYHTDVQGPTDPDYTLHPPLEAFNGGTETFSTNGNTLHITRFGTPQPPYAWLAEVTTADGVVHAFPTDALPSYTSVLEDDHARVRIALSGDGKVAFLLFQASLEPRVNTTEVWRIDEQGATLATIIPWRAPNYRISTTFRPTEQGVFSVVYRGSTTTSGREERAVLLLE